MSLVEKDKNGKEFYTGGDSTQRWNNPTHNRAAPSENDEVPEAEDVTEEPDEQPQDEPETPKPSPVDTEQPAPKQSTDNVARLPSTKKIPPNNADDIKNQPLTGMARMKEKFRMTAKRASNFDKPIWLYKDLIIKSHVVVIPAPPNGGKTTIFMYLAGVMAATGCDVLYVTTDVGQSEIGAMAKQAEDNNFIFLTPDVPNDKGVKSGMNGVIDELKLLVKTEDDLSNTVMIFDTLKKMTDVISKRASKNLYQLLRSLSTMGMTIILLAHTNKYTDSDNHLIYEGTADLRSDVDELIYFDPVKNLDGSMTVSTRPDKVRGLFKKITFTIDSDLNVSQDKEHRDVSEIIKYNQQRDKDDVAIDCITQAITDGSTSTTRIQRYIKDNKLSTSVRAVNQVLIRYTGILWEKSDGTVNNEKVYSLVSTLLG